MPLIPPRSYPPRQVLGALMPTHRYVVLCEGEPVYTTDHPEDLLTYLWGRMIRRHPGAPYRYTVLDWEVPYVVDTGDLCAFVARLPVDAPLPRPCLPLRQEDAC